MKRRNFLIGVGGTALGGSALLGSGAFSRVESHRQVAIQVANDANAYLGLKLLDTPNSNNFADYDEDGHLFIDIGDFGADGEYDYETGTGVNSDSYTWFDGMFEMCNQGKADATISYELPDGVLENTADTANDPNPRPGGASASTVPTVAFYFRRDDGTRVVLEPGMETDLPLGECEEVGVRTVTKGINASDGPLIDGDVTLTAEAPDAGTEPENGGAGS